MTRSLHHNPSLVNLRKRAKALKKAWAANDPAAKQRIGAIHPQLSKAQPRLSDCQLVLAREAGFDNWSQFKVAIESARKDLPEQFIRLACLCYGDPHYDHRQFHAQAQNLLRENSWLSKADIWSAATARDTAAVRAFLDDEPDLMNRAGPEGWTPLFCACYSRVKPLGQEPSTLEVAKLLLERGADANTGVVKEYYSKLRFTALTGLFGGGDTGMANQPAHPQWREMAELLLRHGASPADSTAMRITQGSLTFEKLSILLAHGLKPDALMEKEPLTLMGVALSRAIYMRDRASVKILLDHHVRTDERFEGKVPWQLAMERGELEIARLLEEAGAPTAQLSDVERFVSACLAGDEEATRTMAYLVPAAPKDIVQRAVNTRDLAAVKLALDLGFDPNFQDDSAAIHSAGVLAEHPDILKLLLARGADLTLREPFYDSTGIGWADFFDHVALREKLLNQPGICLFDALDYGRLDRVADVLKRDPTALERPFAKCLSREPRADDWQTPLVRMVEKGKTEAVRVLLAHGADTSATHPSGVSAVELAREKGFAEIERLLSTRLA